MKRSHRQYAFEKLKEAQTMMQYPHTPNNNIYYSNKRESPPFFHLDTNNWPLSGPFCWQNPGSGCNSGNDLVIVLEYIFFSNFVPRPNKSVRFTRFRRNYVNRTAVVLTEHCQITLFFLLDCTVQSSYFPFFCSCLTWMIVHLRNLFLLSTRVTWMW